MAPRRRGHPAPGMEIQGLGSKVLSRAHFAVWLESSPPHILHLPQHPQTPVWLTERRKETLCGVANVCSYPQAGNQELLCQVPITIVFNVTKEGKMDPRSLAPRCA